MRTLKYYDRLGMGLGVPGLILETVPLGHRLFEVTDGDIMDILISKHFRNDPKHLDNFGSC